MPSNVLAGLYNGHRATPGTEITNTAHFSYDTGGNMIDGMTASHSFVVQPQGRVKPARLRAMQLHKDGLPAETIGVHTSEFSPNGDLAGPFVTMALPDILVNLSNSQNSGAVQQHPNGIIGPVDLSEVERVHPNRLVFWVLDDETLNFDAAVIDPVVVTLTDSVTGDTEVLRFWETGPDTGQFSAWIQTRVDNPTHGNGIMSTQALSQIVANYEDPFSSERNLSDDVVVGPVDPYGVLFDTSTGQPIDGVDVTIIDLATGQPAQVWGLDLVSTYPSTVTTGSTVTDSGGVTYNLAPGEFRFPFVNIGDYQFVVDIGDRYVLPSASTDATIQALPGAPYTIVQGSRLEPFQVVPGPPIEIDIPADRIEIAQITRTADRDEASVGDFVEYTVEIVPSVDGPIDVTDLLPVGVEVLDITIEINGATYPVDVTDRREFFWDDFPGLRGQPIIITYVARVGLGASGQLITESGSLTTSTGVTGSGLRDARDEHVLTITPAFDMDAMAIVGDITSGACGVPKEEVNLSGIRVYLENGEYAVTDKDGRFSFRDVANRPRVLQLDELTLPRGAEAILCENNTRKAGNPLSQFLHARPGMLQRAHFRIQFGSDDLRIASEDQRPVPGLPALSEISDYEGEDGDYQTTVVPGGMFEYKPDAEKRPSYTKEWLEQLSADAKPGMLSPRDGELPRRSSIAIEVLKGPGSTIRAFVNGEPVSNLQKRQSISSSKHRLTIERWNGVSIQEGRNEVKIVTISADGTKTEEVREVLYATSIEAVELVQEGTRLETDGRSTPIIKVRLIGEGGIPVRPGTQAMAEVSGSMTFEPNGGRRSQNGGEKALSNRTRVTVEEDGIVTLILSPILQNQSVDISFPRGAGEEAAKLPVTISAADRPWIFVGLAEGSWAEKSIRRHMRRPGDIDMMSGAGRGRVAFFAEGVIKGKWLMTLRYDSAHDEDEFFQIDPDKDYWIFGDRSTQGNAAKSRYPLYLRMKTEEAEFLIGDFTPEMDTELVRVGSQMSGAKYTYENDSWRVVAFAAEVGQNVITDRIPLNGTSGPFDLTMKKVVSGSDTVRIETISRSDATEVLSSEELVAGVDYVIDRSEGTIFLRRPITAFTVDLDRNVLVVDYQSKDKADDGYIGGLRVEHQVSEGLQVGGSVIRATNLDGGTMRADLQSLDAELKISEGVTVSAETVRTVKENSLSSIESTSSVLRFDAKKETYKIEAYLKSIDGNVGLNSTTGGDRVDIAGGAAKFKLADIKQTAKEDEAPKENPDEMVEDKPAKNEGMDGDGLFIETEVVAERNHTQGSRSSTASAMLTRKAGDLILGAGLEQKTKRTSSGRGDSVKAALLLETKSEDEKLSFSLGASRALKNTGDATIPDTASMRLGYAYDDRLTIFTTHELSFGNSKESVSTIGFDYAPWEGGAITAGLVGALQEGVSGQGVFFGLSHEMQIGESVVMRVAVDAQRDLGDDLPVGGSVGNPYLTEAFTTASLETRKTTDSWSAGGSFEYSITETKTSMGFSLSADGELNDLWSVGGELLLGRQEEENGDVSSDIGLRLAAAHRQGAYDPITLLMVEADTLGDDGFKLYGSVYHNRPIGDRGTLGLRYGLKHNRMDYRGHDISDTMHLIGAEYRHDFSDKLDFGLHGAVMHSMEYNEQRLSYGISLGLTPFENGYLNFGYNIEGFRDPEFSANGYTDRGAFIEFRMKVDQTTLERMFR